MKTHLTKICLITFFFFGISGFSQGLNQKQIDSLVQEDHEDL